MTRETFAIGDTIRQSHLDAVDDMTRLLRRFRENAIRDGICLAQANKLVEALRSIALWDDTAVQHPSCALDMRKVARQTLADWERGNATNLDL